MARHADHQQRRAQFADAAISVAATSGLDGVTVARVAGEAGVSVGLVQHYFPTKRELMVQAYTRVLDRALGRVAALVERQERTAAPIRAMMIDGLSELLPLDRQRRVEVSLRAQFHGRAIVDPQLAEAASRTQQAVRHQVAQAVRNGRLCGETAADADPDRAAWSLWCLTDGLADAMLAEPGLPARAVLDEAVVRVFPNPCARNLMEPRS